MCTNREECEFCMETECDGFADGEGQLFEDDGQPDEYTEWQDVFGGDETPCDYDQFEGQYDEY